MASLMGSRTDQTLRHSLSDAGRLSRLSMSFAPAAADESGHKCVSPAQAAADHGGGHLDFRAAGYDTSALSGSPLGSMATDELATAIAAMTDDQTAMHAGLARTAHQESFEEVAGWFETQAPAAHIPSTT